jgi:hypothetical protein
MLDTMGDDGDGARAVTAGGSPRTGAACEDAREDLDEHDLTELGHAMTLARPDLAAEVVAS